MPKHKDTVSEQDFTIQNGHHISTEPEDDSPSGSDADAESEYLSGVGFLPNESTDSQDEKDEERNIPENLKVVSSNEETDRDSTTVDHQN